MYGGKIEAKQFKLAIHPEFFLQIPVPKINKHKC